MPKIIKIGRIEVDKTFVPQKWRPGRWNWKVFWILKTKLVLGSAIFIRIGAVTMEVFLIKDWCFFNFSINYCTLRNPFQKKFFLLNYPNMNILQFYIETIIFFNSNVAIMSFKHILVFSWFSLLRISYDIKLFS